MKSTCTIDELCALSDEMLVTRAKEGNEIFMAAIVSRYWSLVKAKACLYACYSYEAEDLFQEGMLGLLNAMRNYDDKKGASFRTFAGVCIVNNILSALKSVSRRRHIPSSLFISINSNENINDFHSTLISEHEINPEDIIIQREGVKELMNYINKRLSSFEMAVFTAYLGGYPYSEIAKRMYSDSKAIDNALQRAKYKLSEILL